MFTKANVTTAVGQSLGIVGITILVYTTVRVAEKLENKFFNKNK